MACKNEGDRYPWSTKHDLWSAHPCSPGGEQPHLPQPNFSSGHPWSPVPPHQRLCQKGVTRQEPLQWQAADHQHDPPAPCHGAVCPCIQGFGPTSWGPKDLDWTPPDDPRCFSTSTECNGPHRGPPGVHPHPTIPTECVRRSCKQWFRQQLCRNRHNTDGESDLSEPNHGEYGRQLVLANRPVRPNPGSSAKAAPPEPAPNHWAAGCPIVQPERCRPRHWTPRVRSSPTGPICPDPVRRQQFWKPWWTRKLMWTRTRTWPQPIQNYCGPCTPSHDFYGREDTSITGNAPGNRRWILCTPTPGACPSPPIFEPHEEVCQLECMLFLWVRCGQWPHQPDMPPTFEEAR